MIWVLATTSPNYYIRTHDDEGASTFSRVEITRMRRALPRITEALTGAPYRGQIVTGEADRDRDGWITIVEDPDLDDDVCGRAGIGWSAGRIWMNAPQPSGCSFEETFIHEVGHALGFWHVANPSNVMYVSNESDWFTDRETFHARAAYQLGRWHPYVDDRTRFTAAQEPWPEDFEPPEPRVISCPPGDTDRRVSKADHAVRDGRPRRTHKEPAARRVSRGAAGPPPVRFRPLRAGRDSRP